MKHLVIHAVNKKVMYVEEENLSDVLIKISDEQLAAFDEIPLEEMEKDVADTQAEIDQYRAELEVLKKDIVRNKVPIYLNEGRISQRTDFIKKVSTIIEYKKDKLKNNG
jgi:uncharacterized coiled-coil protein SlyX